MALNVGLSISFSDMYVTLKRAREKAYAKFVLNRTGLIVFIGQE
jgi:hypothetical protein